MIYMSSFVMSNNLFLQGRFNWFEIDKIKIEFDKLE